VAVLDERFNYAETPEPITRPDRGAWTSLVPRRIRLKIAVPEEALDVKSLRRSR
jgi:hypothetical protein